MSHFPNHYPLVGMWEPQMTMTTNNSEMGLEDREGLDDVESDNSGNDCNGSDQDSDDYDDY